MTESYNYNQLLKVQREQLNRKEEELRFIAANVEGVIEAMNKRIIDENANMGFNRNAIHEVFRGCNIDHAVNTIVEEGIKNTS